MKKGFKGNIEEQALQNDNFRKVIYTAQHCQLVLMSLSPNEDIGLEVHEGGDQFFRFEKGQGKVIINETEYKISAGDGVIVPAGAKHNVVNTSSVDALKLYTIYSPAHHKDGIVRATKEEAVENAPEFDGQTTEV